MMNQKKETLWAFYAFLTIAFGFIGFLMAHKMNNPRHMNTHVGLVIGGLISIILWETWGKTHSY